MRPTTMDVREATVGPLFGTTDVSGAATSTCYTPQPPEKSGGGCSGGPAGDGALALLALGLATRTWRRRHAGRR